MEFSYAQHETSTTPSTPFGPADPPATVTTTVPREYVHKAALAEVLLTGWHRTGDDAFTAAAQWPRSHSFYRSRHGVHDPMLFTETVRQVSSLLSHAAYTVPFGHHFIWERFSYTTAPGAEALEAGPRPAEIALDIDCRDVVHRRGRLSALTPRFTARRDGVHLGTAEIRFTSHAPAVYRRLRGGYADVAAAQAAAVPVPLPVPAHRVGHKLRENVVLAATRAPRRWQLRVDTTHPVLFDHPVDHVPGALLLEAARQAAHIVAGPLPTMATSMDARFTRFAELDAPCWIDAEREPGTDRVRTVIHQNGQELFTATVGTAPLAALSRLSGAQDRAQPVYAFS
ncbi:ScbA/BarX family gamma-butyrolactone biosynthesis protein [Streptomyces sp. NPDC090022]|uniref:ScbA/BarX family gamma-butyrolactone biosynthesis protein n=1 Tax=Streptomyces sp. NPDC090022 TaxID=3365920 RepID=UPI0037FCF44C